MFFSIGILDIIDIVAVALILYYIYRLMKNSRSLNIFVGIMIFTLAWVLVSHVLEMKLLGTIFDKLVSVGLIAILIIFQDEIRSFFYNLGNSQRTGFLKVFFHRNAEAENNKDKMMPIVIACLNMSKKRTGALIVIEHQVHLSEVVASGDVINADINQRLIENIFFKNSPLHDGAMIISNNRIKAAGCILPVSHDTDIPKYLGLRHRAAMGISQESDAVAIVVSEETGRITVVRDGKFHLNLSGEELEAELTESLARKNKNAEPSASISAPPTGPEPTK